MREKPLEQLLAHCLQEVTHTEDIETVLRRHPQEASQLRPLLEIAVAASRYHADVPEPPHRLAAGRRRLLESAARQRQRARATAIPVSRKERKPKMKLLLATKLISAVLAVAVGTTLLGGGVAMAANESLPGDALYPMKTAVEDIRLDLASTPNAQVNLALQFADERVEEIEELTEKNKPVTDGVVARMGQHVQRAMNQAAWASEEEMPGLIERIAVRTQAQAQQLEQLRTRAQEQSQVQLQNAQQLCQRAHEEATNGLTSPQIFRQRYQQREGMPEDVTPPEPATQEPQSGGEENQGPGGQGQNQADPPQGEQDQEQNQQQDGQQNQQQDQQQNQQQGGQQNQQQDQQQNQQQDQQGTGGTDTPNGPASSPQGSNGTENGNNRP